MQRFYVCLLFVLLSVLTINCKKNGTDASKKDPNGNWKVSHGGGSHCLAPTFSTIITVSGNQFSATLVTWGSNRLSIAGTITMGNINFIVSGNETISGSGCNGTNGFFAYIDPNGSPVSGSVSSNWGSLLFEKQ